MTEKEIVCRVAGRIVAIVVLDDDKEVDPRRTLLHTESLRGMIKTRVGCDQGLKNGDSR